MRLLKGIINTKDGCKCPSLVMARRVIARIKTNDPFVGMRWPGDGKQRAVLTEEREQKGRESLFENRHLSY